MEKRSPAPRAEKEGELLQAKPGLEFAEFVAFSFVASCSCLRICVNIFECPAKTMCFWELP